MADNITNVIHPLKSYLQILEKTKDNEIEKAFERYALMEENVVFSEALES